jgi:anti-sigma factor RsiW
MPEAPLNHPSAEELRALSLGQLPEAELARLSAHLGDCPACCRRIDQLAAADTLLTRLQQTAARQEKELVTPAQRRPAVRALRQGSPARAAARGPDPETAPAIRPAPGRSGTTTSWPRSAAGAWGWCTGRGTGACGGWWP